MHPHRMQASSFHRFHNLRGSPKHRVKTSPNPHLRLPLLASPSPVGVFSKAADTTPESAQAFVKDIPQSQPAVTAGKKLAMGRKEYILIADAIKSSSLSDMDKEAFARHIAPSLRADNSAFLEDRFVDYVMGKGGPRGGTRSEEHTSELQSPVHLV